MTEAEKTHDATKVWQTIATVVTAVVAIGGLLLYALLSTLYGQFYGSLGIDPGEVGLTYANTISGASGLVLIVAVSATVITCLGWYALRSKERAGGVLGILSAVAVASLGALILTGMQASDVGPAAAVKSGEPVRPAQLGPFVMLPIHADPATVSAIGKPPEQTKAIDALAGRTLFYLGRSNGVVVLYDSDSHQVLHLPEAVIVLTIKNCETRKSADPICRKVHRP